MTSASLQRLRAIRHIEIIPIHSRVPRALPQRITPALATLLKRYHPLYLNTQFNHPDEITPSQQRRSPFWQTISHIRRR